MNFSYQYMPEAKAYLEPNRTSTMKFYREKLFSGKFTRKHLCLSLLNKVTGLYPATSLKDRTPTQVFYNEFCEILKTPFLQNTSRRLRLFYGKIFYL